MITHSNQPLLRYLTACILDLHTLLCVLPGRKKVTPVLSLSKLSKDEYEKDKTQIVFRFCALPFFPRTRTLRGCHLITFLSLPLSSNSQLHRAFVWLFLPCTLHYSESRRELTTTLYVRLYNLKIIPSFVVPAF
jgi:hypothetical protein